MTAVVRRGDGEHNVRRRGKERGDSFARGGKKR